MLITALRKRDVLSLTLTREHMQSEGLRVQVSKKARRGRGKDSEIVTVHYWKIYKWTPRLRTIVDRAKGLRRRVGSIYLFANQDGQRYTESGFDSIWRRLKKRAAWDFTFHDLRKKALTDAKRLRGVEYAQALGDHEDVSTTERYTSNVEDVIVEPLE